MPSSETSVICPHSIKTVKLPNGESIQIAEWGEYPQAVTSLSMHKTLDKELSMGRLKKTGKKYTFDSEDLTAYKNKFNPRECPEFEFGGKRYIHLIAKPAGENSVLSTGETVEDDKMYWVEVQPIEWLKDETGVWIAKKALFAGIQFDIKNRYDGNFNNTFMKTYLDTYFSKDIQPTREYNMERSAEDKAIVNDTNENQHEDQKLLLFMISLGELKKQFETLTAEEQKTVESLIDKIESPKDTSAVSSNSSTNKNGFLTTIFKNRSNQGK